MLHATCHSAAAAPFTQLSQYDASCCTVHYSARVLAVAVSYQCKDHPPADRTEHWARTAHRQVSPVLGCCIQHEDTRTHHRQVLGHNTPPCLLIQHEDTRTNHRQVVCLSFYTSHRGTKQNQTAHSKQTTATASWMVGCLPSATPAVLTMAKGCFYCLRGKPPELCLGCLPGTPARLRGGLGHWFAL